MTRALAAARLYILNKWMLLWLPLILLGAMVALTIVVQLVVLAAGGDQNDVVFNGAFQAVFWCILGVAVAASTQMFPFAFAMSLTRRDFVFGTLIVALVVGAGYGLVYAVVAWLETATDGYGIGAHSFNLMGFAGGSVFESFVFYGGLMLVFFMVGFAASMLWKRFGGKGMVLSGLLFMIVCAGLLAWAGLVDAWARIGEWMSAQTPSSVGLYATAVSLLLAGGTYLMIRHAEP